MSIHVSTDQTEWELEIRCGVKIILEVEIILGVKINLGIKIILEVKIIFGVEIVLWVKILLGAEIILENLNRKGFNVFLPLNCSILHCPE